MLRPRAPSAPAGAPLLYKMKKVASPFCPFCPSDSQTIQHLFISCTQASSFWNKFQNWYMIESNENLLLSELDVLFGITRSCAHRLVLNHLILLSKYFLYGNALNSIKHVFNDFVALVHGKMEIEKYIAATSNDEKNFRQKWKFLLTS